MEDDQKRAYFQAQVLLANFTKRSFWSRREVAKVLGCHTNSLYNDEQLLLEVCEPYKQTLRRSRMEQFQVWLILLTRCLISNGGRNGKQTAQLFFIFYPELTTKDEFNRIIRRVNDHDPDRKIKRVQAA